MKNLNLILAFALATMTAKAQVTVQEPEFIDSYCILTSDTSCDVLPKENGMIGEHKNKAKGLLSKIGKVANVASAIGMGVAHVGMNSGNITTIGDGVKVVGAASSVGNIADASSALAGANGMDIKFKGKASEYTYKSDGKDLRLLVKAENNEVDPRGLYRLVKFNVSGKERSIQWMEFKPDLLGAEKTLKGGYLNFNGTKYGQKSYILTVPADKVEKGQYGLFYMGVINSTVIPIGTFGIE